MKISELIETLGHLRTRHGDVVVYVRGANDHTAEGIPATGVVPNHIEIDEGYSAVGSITICNPIAESEGSSEPGEKNE